jgi:hypothetical protein
MAVETGPLLAKLWKLQTCIIAGGHNGKAPIHGKEW